MESGAVIQLVITAFMFGGACYAILYKVNANSKELKKISDNEFSTRLYIEQQLSKLDTRCKDRHEFNRKEISSLIKLMMNKGAGNGSSNSRR